MNNLYLLLLNVTSPSSFMKYNLKYPIHSIISKFAKSNIRTKDMIYKDNRLNDLKTIPDDKLDLAYNEVMDKIKSINEYLFDDKESDLRKIFNIDKEQKL